MRVHTLALVLLLLIGPLASTPATAQVLGTFRWQQLPYCNVLTLVVTQNGAVYRLEGTDDQCGAARQASVLGTAFPNPDGTIGMGFTVVATPGGAPQHVDVTIELQTFSGTWRDGAGRTGTLAFRPGPGTGGSPRPPGGGLGAQAVDTAQVQLRLANGCATGEAVRTVNEDGSVVCQAVVGTGGGTITGVTAGAGLSGGGSSGAVTIGVATGGIGAAQIADGSVGVADIDLDEVQQKVRSACGAGLFMVSVNASGNVVCTPGAGGVENTALGQAALAATSGSFNTAAGAEALMSNTTGANNSAFGRDALRANTGGIANAALGDEALRANTAGNGNIAAGRFALGSNTVGSFNSAVGEFALGANTAGGRNTAVGQDSLRSNAAGEESTAVGWRALFANQASFNTAVGAQALVANTSGDWNTAVGSLALQNNIAGARNTAVGRAALAANSASSNTAVGFSALEANTIGGSNTAVGGIALWTNVSGQRNTAHGWEALFNSTGSYNTALGASALHPVTTGEGNIGIGWRSGWGSPTGDNNISIGVDITVDGSNTIRIGRQTASSSSLFMAHSRAFIAGIRGVTTGSATGINVLVDANGQLGTTSSSRRYKQDITAMGEQTRGLHHLRPVTFRYIDHAKAGSTRLEFGLVAEEVADVYPDLVVFNERGDVETVQYHKLAPMLLNEVQRLERDRAALEDRLEGQQREIAELRAQLATLAGATPK